MTCHALMLEHTHKGDVTGLRAAQLSSTTDVTDYAMLSVRGHTCGTVELENVPTDCAAA